jgi:hypothetical protein
MAETQDQLNSAIQLFLREDQTVSFWDHPNFKSHVTLPDDCHSITRVEQGLELLQQGRLSKEALAVMKVVGDAMCANENQLRRYLSRKMSASRTSAILKKLRKYRLVERYKCRLAFVDEDSEEAIRPPAPFALGIGGYKLLKYYYPDQSFMQVEQWYSQPLSVQRYVAMNEFRCLAAEARVLRGWKWNPYIGGSPKYMKPMAVAKIETAKGNIEFILEKPQMAQNFLGYLRSKLEQYRGLYERDHRFLLDGSSKDTMQIVCLYVSSLSMAKYIHEELGLQSYPFDLCILIDEWIDSEKGMSEAFCIPNKLELKKVRFPYFKKYPLNSND